jgi:hypothetical protein
LTIETVTVMATERHETKFRASQAVKDAMEKELTELEGRINRLRVLYDQYFMGIERMEPTYLRTEVEKIFRRSDTLRRGSTSLKFRFRSMQQRYTSYRSYWDRIVRMIEDGKIRRGVNALGQRLPSVGDELPSAQQGRVGSGPEESLSSKRRRFRRRAEEGSVGDAAEAAAASLAGGAAARERCEFAPTETDALFNCLVREKQRAGEDTSKLTSTIVEKSVQKILDRVAGSKEVQFKVVSKDGRVSLKAVVKKDAGD